MNYPENAHVQNHPLGRELLAVYASAENARREILCIRDRAADQDWALQCDAALIKVRHAAESIEEALRVLFY